MMKIYYVLWVDFIVNSKGFKNKESDWKATAYFIMTMANALNIFVILLWLDYLNINMREYLLILETGSILSSALGGFICFGLPFALINYFAIFYKNRYKRLIERYTSNFNGKLALSYVFGNILMVVLTVILTS